LGGGQHFCIGEDPESLFQGYEEGHHRVRRMGGLVALALHFDAYAGPFKYSHLSDDTRRWLEVVDDYYQFDDRTFPGNVGASTEEKKRVARAIEEYPVRKSS